jgi:hypothetical protein
MEKQRFCKMFRKAGGSWRLGSGNGTANREASKCRARQIAAAGGYQVEGAARHAQD